RGQRLHSKLGDIVLQAGDTLLVETDAGFARRHGGSTEFLVASEIGRGAKIDRRGAVTVLLIVAMMVVANTVFGVDILLSALVAAAASILTRCVSLVELRRS